jgi:hypothetical protein
MVATKKLWVKIVAIKIQEKIVRISSLLICAGASGPLE